MSHAVVGALNGLVAANALPALAPQLVALNARLHAIKAAAATQARPTTGQTVDRNQVLAVATAATLAVAGRVRSYARSQKLGVLEAKVRLRPSTFKKVRLAHRIPLMQQVHDAAQDVLSQLADFGVTAELLTDLQARITAADAVKTLLRSTIVERRVATAKLLELFRELTDFLENEVDPLVDSLRETSPEGWATYRAARDIINQPGTPAQPEARVQTAAAPTASTEKLAA